MLCYMSYMWSIHDSSGLGIITHPAVILCWVTLLGTSVSTVLLHTLYTLVLITMQHIRYLIIFIQYLILAGSPCQVMLFSGRLWMRFSLRWWRIYALPASPLHLPASPLHLPAPPCISTLDALLSPVTAYIQELSLNSYLRPDIEYLCLDTHLITVDAFAIATHSTLNTE